MDGLDLTVDGAFRSLCVRWPTSFGEEFRMIVEATILEWWEREATRPGPGLPPSPGAKRRRPTQSVRALVMRAVDELRDEFAGRVAAKLASILGTGTPALPSRVRTAFGGVRPPAARAAALPGIALAGPLPIPLRSVSGSSTP